MQWITPALKHLLLGLRLIIITDIGGWNYWITPIQVRSVINYPPIVILIKILALYDSGLSNDIKVSLSVPQDKNGSNASFSFMVRSYSSKCMCSAIWCSFSAPIIDIMFLIELSFDTVYSQVRYPSIGGTIQLFTLPQKIENTGLQSLVRC